MGTQTGAQISLEDSILKRAAWNCINNLPESWDNPAKDQLAINEVSGVEYFQVDSEASWTKHTKVLDGNNIESWIQQPFADTAPSTTPSSPTVRGLKLLLGRQVINRYGFYPPEDMPAVRLSGKNLAKSFKIPPIAVVEATPDAFRFMQFPSHLCPDPNIECRAFSTTNISAVWSYDAQTMVTQAFIVFGSTVISQGYEKFLLDLDLTQDYLIHPECLPFVITNTSILLDKHYLAHSIRTGMAAELQISRYPDSRKRTELFAAANDRSDSLGTIRRSLEILLFSTEHSLNQQLQRPPSIPDEAWSALQVIDSATLAGFRCTRQLVLTMIGDADQRQAQVARQLSTLSSTTNESQQQTSIEIAQQTSRLAEASHRDQAVSIEIARASKTIAFESKRDSSSMKTLAIVTMVYLPGTSVAALLSLPFFSWNSPNQPHVNGHLWIYFCVTVPLTIVTFVVWWLWFAFQTKRETREMEKELRSESSESTAP